MNSRTTYILVAITLSILSVAIVTGMMSQQPTPKPAPAPAVQKPKELSRAQLDSKLPVELPAITTVLETAYPQLTALYDISKNKLYGDGTWYGALLVYKGTDENNRDTLRVLMQKKSNAWIVRSKPPSLILSSKEYPDTPKAVLKDINLPAPLPGTSASPAIQ